MSWGDFEFVEVGRRFPKWKELPPGTCFTGRVTEFDPDGGTTDSQGNTCGFLLLEEEKGSEVFITLCYKNLIRAVVEQGKPVVGDICQIRFNGSKPLKDRPGKFYYSFSFLKARTQPKVEVEFTDTVKAAENNLAEEFGL